MLPNNDAFADIRLGPLLGKGSFGRVYRATWNGTNVAVKIVEFIDEDGSSPGDALGDGVMLDGANDASGNGNNGGVRDSDSDDGKGRALLEGLLQERVSHPNVVRNFKFLTRPTRQEDADGGHADGWGDAAPNINCATFSMRPGGGGNGFGSPDRGSGDFLSPARPQAPRRKRRVMEAWLILEFCNRGCIADGIDKGWFRQPRSMFEPAVRRILTTAREVAAAMAYLHSEGILHGDLTSANVLLTTAPEGVQGDPRGFVAKVSDFGLSRSVDGEGDGVLSTRTYGTVTHMPPELLMEGRMSKAADVYSFGVVLWEMFQGGRPFAGLTHSQVLHAISTGKALSPPKSTPEAVRPLLAACIAPKPEARPKFTEVLQTLEDLEERFPW